MTERPNDTRLHDWLDATIGQTPDPVAGTRQVMSRIDERAQAGRWLPVPLLRRQPRSPTATSTRQIVPSPIPATNGRNPTVIGRTHTMFSPTKAVIAGALVFGIGGALLIAQPFDRPGTTPGAEAEAAPPTWVTGQIGWASSCTGPETDVDGAVIHERNYDCSPQAWTASDPRLSGEVRARWNNDVYRVDNRYIAVNSSLDVLENDEGAWECTSTGLFEGQGASGEALGELTTTCVGQDGYEGLSAVIVRTFPAASGTEEFSGLIFSGDLPPLPDPPAAE